MPISYKSAAEQIDALRRPDEPRELAIHRWVWSRMAAADDRVVCSPWWEQTLDAFYRSGKTTLCAAVAYQGGKSRTMAACIAGLTIANQTKALAGDSLKSAIVSANLPEAGQRRDGISAALKSLGFARLDRYSEAEGLREGEYAVQGSPGGRTSIKFNDLAGNTTEIATGPNTAEFTGFQSITFGLDEFGLYPHDQAPKILENAVARFTSYQGAKLFIISRPYADDCPMSKICSIGDNDDRVVARVGVEGARADTDAKAMLRAFFELRATEARSPVERRNYAAWAIDPRIQSGAAPEDWRIPTWVARGLKGQAAGGVDVIKLWLAQLGSSIGNDALDRFLSAHAALPCEAGESLLFDPLMIDRAINKGLDDSPLFV